MDNKFFTFIKPYLSFIDNGHLYRKPFSWLHTLLAVVNLILPIYFFYRAADNGIFDYPAEYIIVFLLVWIIIAFASWVSFQLWWDRKSKLISNSSEGDEFVATPVFSHLIQTIGEWLGNWIGIVGFSVALLTNLILSDKLVESMYYSERADRYFLQELGLSFIETEHIFIILWPIYGFLIIVATRFLAEQFRALSSIANNTRKN